MPNLFLIVCLVAGISGCASSGRIGEMPTVAPGQPTAKLSVIRVSSILGVANSYYIAIDGKDVFAIRSGEYTEFNVVEGEHYLAVKCFGGWIPTWKEDSTKFIASSQKESFFEISPNMKCAQIRSIEAEEANKLVATSKFISPETLSGSK